MSQQRVVRLSDHVAGSGRSVAAKDRRAFVAGRHDGGREPSARAPTARGRGDLQRSSAPSLQDRARDRIRVGVPESYRDGGPSRPPSESASHLSARAELCEGLARDNMHIRSLHHD